MSMEGVIWVGKFKVWTKSLWPVGVLEDCGT
jgi:hypothetical protein